MMIRMRAMIGVSLMVGASLMMMAGCATKSVRSGGETQLAQRGVGETGQGMQDLSLSGRNGGEEGLRGLDKNPSEERVGSNVLMAKSDPGSAARQMDEIRAEQAAAAAAGLRDVFFAFDSFVITEEGRQALSRNAQWIKANQGAQLRIEGHCDERGTSAYNLVLGEKRAKAARNYLVELGVSPSQLSVVSYGKERPFCKEHDESCYAQNRRAHMVVKANR
ncbi:MAG: peptidoglycan-associated lipoprotein Pal [Nitrospira sp.]|nr:peptidoglycan-associated lipoprotein Pal [Nitrospira sp.]MCP9465073.1 peptidoglycan-associated lipoprotein Pal [Nitrospira sp.]